MRQFIAAAALAVLPVATPAIAQDDQAEIVVESPKLHKQRIYNFITTLTPSRFGAQLGRFHFPVCPAATGLPEAQNAAVAARLREVAEAVDVRVAADGCTPNLFVVVTADKAAKIAEIGRHYPGLVANVPADRLRQLAEAETPAVAWHVVDEVSSDGLEVSRDEQGVKWVSSTQDPSRLRKPTAPHYLAAVVVVEAAALAGRSTGQLADYAAMRALAPIDPLHHRHAMAGNPDGVPPADSILTLLDSSPPEPPLSVTWWDFAFLKALYASSNSYAANLQRGEMQARMAGTLAEVPVEDR